MSVTSLTKQGVNLAVNQSGTPVILQVLNFKDEEKMINQQKSFLSEISDGYAKIKCYWDNAVYNKILDIGRKVFNGSVVRLTSYVSTPKNIMVSSFDLIFQINQQIGNPVNYKQYLAGNTNSSSTNVLNGERTVEKSTSENKPSNANSNNKRPIISLNNNPPMNQKMRVRDPTMYQLIEDIYVDIANWSLYCRVTKTNWKDFINKKGSQTKLLQFEIKDRKDWTIKCIIFGSEAQKKRETIKDGQVYIFSQGIIKLDNFKKPLNSKDSPFTITFNEHSRIQAAVDDGSISTSVQSDTKILDIPNLSPGSIVEVIAILKQIGPEIQFTTKATSQQSSKRILKICDPITRTQIDVTLWRQQMKIDESLLGKTLLFSSFKTHQYNGKYSLSAWSRSSISQTKNHSFAEFQKSINSMSFQSLSYRRGQSQRKPNISSIKELITQSQTLSEGETLWSTFRIYISKFKEIGKKWYQGCPHCKKAIPLNRSQSQYCSNCDKYFEEPILRYILNVQISDCLGSGSIWTTVHDDLANKILGTIQECPASRASKMLESQFASLCQQCQFLQFKATISSKVQIIPGDFYLKKIKHQISSLSPFQHSLEAKSNLEIIKNKYV